MQASVIDIRTTNVMRYVVPLREGGSLPAIAEADDGFMYVLKFKGAGQGAKALIAELIGGLLAKKLGLKVPEIVFAQLDTAFGRTEPDEEIQDLLKASTGTNIALHYLSGAVAFDPAVTIIDEELASKIVWLDSFICNVDRTVRNTNMLMWNKELWLIDHGASLYFHHSWQTFLQNAERPFEQVKDHVLLQYAVQLKKIDELFHSILSEEKIDSIVSLIPDEWLQENDSGQTADKKRSVYAAFLKRRFAASGIFTQQAKYAREAIV
ncbi:MAG: aminotransferase class I and II [Parafilimonas sp.]|nr:aminotransferase class I and II [Parafilimonas sp.]